MRTLDRNRYRAEGCDFPIDVLTPAEAGEHRRRLEAVERERGSLHYAMKPYLVFSSAHAIARHPAILEAVAAVLGPDILIWNGSYITKEPRSPGFVSWHQDLTYTGLDGDAFVTVWLALSRADAASGAMRYLPGSQSHGRREHRLTEAKDNLLSMGQEVPDVDPGQAHQVVLAPGQASLHHGWLVHASDANRSDDRRIGLALNYVAPHMRQVVASGETATLVRGVDRYGHFPPEPAYAGDFDPAVLAFQREADRQKLDTTRAAAVS